MDRVIEVGVLRRRRVRRVAVGAGCAAGLLVLVVGLPRLLRPSLPSGTLRIATVERGEVEALLQPSVLGYARGVGVGDRGLDPEQIEVGDASQHVPRSYGATDVGDDPGQHAVVLRARLGQLEPAEAALRQTEVEGRTVPDASTSALRRLSDLAGRREAKRLDAELNRYRL
ncbi:MAG TPA: hypothetical protein VD788_09545 [Candidatus Polarisedimenticolaceae bacterium]|nr:hypothetical protein [Candidatus Polarisedimenticolaceae bacterium]